MILADDEGKLHLKYTCWMHIHTHILFYNIVEYMMYIQSHIHTHTIFIYISGLKDDSCGRRWEQHLAHRYKSTNAGAIFLLYQYKSTNTDAPGAIFLLY
jgi:hypothetical protein